jgi:hypothetical protein
LSRNGAILGDGLGKSMQSIIAALESGAKKNTSSLPIIN